MFIITHDLEAALICDKTAILRDGKLLEFDDPHKLISSLPSNGLVLRLTLDNLNEKMIDIIKNFEPIKKILRVGNDILELLVDNFEDNLSRLIQFLVDKGIKVNSMNRDLATFRRFFQIRIDEEQEKESKEMDSIIADRGDIS